LHTALHEQVKRKGGRSAGASITGEVNRAVREYLAREAAAGPLGPVHEAVDEVVFARLGQMEAWLRPMLANAGINATAALLASVEVVCGTRVPKEKVREFVDLLRGRAYALYRRPGNPEAEERS